MRCLHTQLLLPLHNSGSIQGPHYFHCYTNVRANVTVYFKLSKPARDESQKASKPCKTASVFILFHGYWQNLACEAV